MCTMSHPKATLEGKRMLVLTTIKLDTEETKDWCGVAYSRYSVGAFLTFEKANDDVPPTMPE